MVSSFTCPNRSGRSIYQKRLNVEAPSQYSTVSAGLLWELGIDRTRYFEQNRDMFSFYRELGLRSSMFFDEETFGADKLVVGYGASSINESIAQSPLSDKAKQGVKVYVIIDRGGSLGDGFKIFCKLKLIK